MATTIKKDIYMTSLGEVAYFTICDDECGLVVLSALGAGVVALSVPDGNGEYRDVVTGYQSAETYCHDDPNAGKFIGRYANRIARGVFSIDGNEYHLECNCGPNALHGGREGFAHRIWKSRTVGDNAVEFSLTSDDGDQGYPGTLTVKALYTWMPSCGLCLDIVATTDRPTVLNLTNHCYFNLDGHNSGCVLNHNLQLNASRYLVTDSSLAPTGELADERHSDGFSSEEDARTRHQCRLPTACLRQRLRPLLGCRRMAAGKTVDGGKAGISAGTRTRSRSGVDVAGSAGLHRELADVLKSGRKGRCRLQGLRRSGNRVSGISRRS